MSGVTPTGFVKKTQSEVAEELLEDQKALVSSKLSGLPSTGLGQVNGIFSDKLRELWDVANALYRAFHPDYASYDALDHIGALTGAKRRGPAKSTVTLDRVLLEDGTTVDAGSIVSVGTNGARFVTLADVSNATGYKGLFSVNAESQEYGEIAGYQGTIDVIVTPVSGWEAKGTEIGTVAESYSLDGLTLAVDGDANTTETAQLFNFSGGNPWSALDVVTFVNASAVYVEAFETVDGKVGISSITDGEDSWVQAGGPAGTVMGFTASAVMGMNSEDAAEGRDTDADPLFRLRREQTLSISGLAMIDAIRANVLQLEFVDQCFVYENVSLVTDGDGVPGKAIEVLVYYTATSERAQLIADAIAEKVSVGIETHGSVSNTVTDQQGFDHTIKHSRPTEVSIYIEIEVVVDADTYPSDGNDQIETLLIALGDTQQVGQDVIALAYKSAVLEKNGGVTGVLDVAVYKIDDVNPPTGDTNITVDSREVATVASVDASVYTGPS